MFREIANIVVEQPNFLNKIWFTKLHILDYQATTIETDKMLILYLETLISKQY